MAPARLLPALLLLGILLSQPQVAFAGRGRRRSSKNPAPPAASAPAPAAATTTNAQPPRATPAPPASTGPLTYPAPHAAPANYDRNSCSTNPTLRSGQRRTKSGSSPAPPTPLPPTPQWPTAWAPPPEVHGDLYREWQGWLNYIPEIRQSFAGHQRSLQEAHDLVIERYHKVFLGLRARLERERDHVDCTLHVLTNNRVAVTLRLRHGHATSVTQPVRRPPGPSAQSVTPPTAELPFSDAQARGSTFECSQHSLDSPPSGVVCEAKCDSEWPTDDDVPGLYGIDGDREFDDNLAYDTCDHDYTSDDGLSKNIGQHHSSAGDSDHYWSD